METAIFAAVAVALLAVIGCVLAYMASGPDATYRSLRLMVNVPTPARR